MYQCEVSDSAHVFPHLTPQSSQECPRVEPVQSPRATERDVVRSQQSRVQGSVAGAGEKACSATVSRLIEHVYEHSTGLSRRS